MSAMTKPSSEMLVLHREENEEIFVDSALHQHHIDGIRFLYRQFKKKRQGVIINNPLGYGNSLQVALFLGAIRELLEKPMLILCEQSEEMTWLEHFQKLTQCYNVGVDAPSPFVKKSIFINTLDRLELFCRRDWSVLVVDTDDFLKEKALQAKFNADFKIWITPVDMKENLKTLSSIFKWLFPKDKLDINEFEAKPGDLNDAVSKSIRLEAFLEDIVCRTTLQTPFENPYDKFEDTPRKSSKKNKDATGTKIKRSKRSLDVPSTSNAPEAKESDTGAPAVKIPKTDNVSNDVSMSNYSDYDEDDDKADIESFIRDKEPISFCPYKDFESSQDSRLEFMDDEPILNTAERLNLLLQTHVPMDIAQNPEICFLDSDSTSDSLLPIPKSFDQLSNDSSYEERKVVTPEFLTDNILNEIKEEMYETHVSIFEDKDDVVKKSNKQDEMKSERESDTVNGKLDLEKEDSLIDKEDPDNLKEEFDNDKDVDKDMEDSVKVVGDQNAVKGKLTDVEEMSDKDKEEPDKVTKESDKVKDSPIKQDLDSKIREMDERAFKKFQGSILDSLF